MRDTEKPNVPEERSRENGPRAGNGRERPVPVSQRGKGVSDVTGSPAPTGSQCCGSHGRDAAARGPWLHRPLPALGGLPCPAAGRPAGRGDPSWGKFSWAGRPEQSLGRASAASGGIGGLSLPKCSRHAATRLPLGRAPVPGTSPGGDRGTGPAPGSVWTCDWAGGSWQLPGRCRHPHFTEEETEARAARVGRSKGRAPSRKETGQRQR